MDNIATNEEIEDNHLGSETDSKFEQLLDAEEIFDIAKSMA